MLKKHWPLLFIIFLISLFFYIFIQKKTTKKHIDPTTVLIVGTNAEFPPFTFMQDGSIVGFDIDIAQEIAQRLKKNIHIKNMSFDALLSELYLGSIHIAAAGLTPTKERAEKVSFITPYVEGGPLVVISLAKNPLHSLEQLKGKIVAVNQGYTSDMYASTLPQVTVVRLSSSMISDGLLALKSGQADAFIASSISVVPFLKDKQSKSFFIQPIEDTQETTAIAVSKRYPELFNEIQKTYTAMVQDGTIKSFQKKWELIHD